MRSRSVLVPVLTTFLLIAGSSHALQIPALGPIEQADPDGARSAFDRAVAALKKKKFDEVDREAREAWRRGFGPDAAELTAVAALQRTKVSLAHAIYLALRADETVPEGPRGRAERQVAALSGQGGQLELAVTPPGARISVDGEDLGPAPLLGPVLAMAGPHRIAIRADGFSPWQQTVRFSKGKMPAVTVALQADSAPPVSSVPPTLQPTPPHRPDDLEARFGPAPRPLAPMLGGGLPAAEIQPLLGRRVDVETRFGTFAGVRLLRVDATALAIGDATSPQTLPLAIVRSVKARVETP